MNRMLLVAFVISTSASLGLADWPQYLGPNRDGVSAENVKLADSWPEGGPKQLWVNPNLGTGYANAVVEGGKIYILDRVKDAQDVLRCLDLATGTEEWNFTYDAVGPDGKGTYKGNYNGSRNHPVVDDKNIYIIGPFGHVNAVSKETHKPVWSGNVVADYGATINNWGLCQSPTLYKDTLILAPLSKQAGLVALDKATGKEKWKTEKIGDMGWSSPLVVTLDGVDVIAMFHSRGQARLTGIDAATGKVLWQHNKLDVPNPITVPVYCGEGRFFLSAGDGAGCFMLKATREGQEWKTEELFKNKNCACKAVNPILYKGYIYANSNDIPKGEKQGNGLVCMDLTGEIKWKTGTDDIEDVGGITIADGKIFRFFSNKNVMTMAAASPEGYKELGRFEVGEKTNNWAPIVVTGGKLLVRVRSTMYCFDVSAGK